MLRSTNLDLALGAGVITLGMGLLAPVLPRYAQSLGASSTLVGLFLASFGVARLLVSLPTAWLVRRLGFRPLLIGSPAIIAAAAVFCALTDSFWSLALFCAVEGAAAASYATASTAALIGKTDRPGRSLALYQGAGLFGLSLGPALGGLLMQQFGPRVPFLVYAALAAFVAGWLISRPHPHPQIAPPSGQLQSPDDKEKSDTQSNWKFLAWPRLLPLWLVGFALVFTRQGLQLLVVPLLGAGQLGLNPLEIGLALSLIGIVGLVALYPAGWLVDHGGPKITIVSGGLLMMLALAGLALAENYTFFLLAIIFFGVGSSLLNPGPLAYLAQLGPKSVLPTGVALYRTIGDAGTVLSPIISGWLIEGSNYSLALLASLGLLVVAIGSFAWVAPGVNARGLKP